MNTMNNQNTPTTSTTTNPTLTYNPSKKNVRIIMIEPGKCAYETKINTDLSSLQAAVDGLIEVLYLDDDTILICNDEGKINGMRPNRALRDEEDQIFDIVCGPFFIARNDDEADDGFGELTDEQTNKYLNMFELPEDIFMVGGEIMAFKYCPDYFDAVEA